MYRVVQTHDQFNRLGVAVSGKTGTAEIDIYHPNNGLFIGYTRLFLSPSTLYLYELQMDILPGNACLTANDIFKYIYELADEDTILTGYASSDTSNVSND